jgi:hypothetical protein
VGSDPKVTVIIPTKDRPRLLGRAVTSAVALGPSVGEVIVVDDGGSAPRSVADQVRVRVISSGGVGVSAARNAGLAAATTDWVAFLDDDDRLTTGWSSLEPLLADPRFGVISGAARRHRGDQSTLVTAHGLGRPFGDATGNVLAGSWVARRRLLDHIGGYATAMRHSENLELWLRMGSALADLNLDSAHVQEVVVDVMDAAEATSRGSHDEQAKVDATSYLIDHHEHRLVLEPSGLANVLRSGAVAAARCESWALARTWQRRGLRHSDQRIADVARLGLMVVPPIGRRVWRGAAG